MRYMLQSKSQEAEQETVSAVAMYTKKEDPQTQRMEPRGFEPRVVPKRTGPDSWISIPFTCRLSEAEPTKMVIAFLAR